MKRLFLIAGICGLLSPVAKADKTTIYTGTYQGSTEAPDGTCVVVCKPSSQACYAVTTKSNTGSQVTYPFNDWQSVDQTQYGVSTTVQAFDEDGNVVATYTGYFGGMSFQSNADGSQTAYISLQAN